MGRRHSLRLSYIPRDVFRDFHGREERWAVMVAHRRCGKTVACINDLIKRAAQEGKRDGRYAYVAPYYAQAKSVAWDYLLKFSEPIRTHANQSELWVQLRGGARIRLYGADNPDALRGLYMDGVILDEFADMRPTVWGSIIRPLLADRNGWAVFIGTPKGKNAFYDVFRYATKSAEWFTKSLRASQTGIIPDAELEDAKKSMSDSEYEQEFEVSFEAAVIGAYYGKEFKALEAEGRIREIEYDRAHPVYSAWDLGYTDSTAIWIFQTILGEIRVLDYYANNGQDVAHYANVLKSKGYKYERHYLPHDARAKTLASNKSVIEQLADHLGLSSLRIVPNLSVQDGIQAARLVFPKIWFDPRCETGYEALKLYQREWDDKGNCFKDRPRHDFTSHPADAFRYLCVAYQEEMVAKPKDDTIRGLTIGKNDVTLTELWDTIQRTDNRRI